MNLRISEKFKIVDSQVGTVLGYVGEVWGTHGDPDIERLQTQFCKHMLDVKIHQTSNNTD